MNHFYFIIKFKLKFHKKLFFNNSSIHFLKYKIKLSTNKTVLEACPLYPPNLFGPLNLYRSQTFENIEKMFPHLEIGGRYRPKDCVSRHKVAIIIPYRDRKEHLKILLRNIHPMLERQQLDYGIYVIEQFGENKFNRAKLLNIGFLESLKQYDYQCFIFHDVDSIPLNDRNLYTCSDQPRQLIIGKNSEIISSFGGVCAMTKEQFQRVNGYSNMFIGWGSEDDDMYNRVIYHGYNVSRNSGDIGIYRLLEHVPDFPNPERFEIAKNGESRFKTDGINSIVYKVLNEVPRKLYTWILVDLNL
jgi:beta-1,4-galactosyltransferase 1